jgi:GNAT superfamily N-acetyltransferase
MVGPFLDRDIPSFLAAAEGEGWICERWEMDFLLRSFQQGCFVYRNHERALGYITSISYGGSGWVGNLLVHPEARNRGIGRELMESACCALLKSGVKTVWLTASDKGVGLYRRLGFAAIDHIIRWKGKGCRGRVPQQMPADYEVIREVDRRGWGNRRDALLEVTCRTRGKVFTSSGGYICTQQWESGTQIGPWGSVIRQQAPQLLDQALVGAPSRVFLDVPAGNHAATELLKERGFTVKGSNVLMYLGAEPLYQPEKVFALASMGSMG